MRGALSFGSGEDHMTAIERTNEIDAREIQAQHYADQALSWHGWGSPVGLGLFLVSLAFCLFLLHQAGLFR
jgi:hypothetical protein